MNLRNRPLLITLRTLFGLFMTFSGVTGFLAMSDGGEGIPEPMLAPTMMLWDMGIFQMIKVTEVVAGLMLVAGVLPALAVLFLAPLGVGIVVFNARMSPQFLPAGVIVCLFLVYLTCAYWDQYREIFRAGPGTPRPAAAPTATATVAPTATAVSATA